MEVENYPFCRRRLLSRHIQLISSRGYLSADEYILVHWVLRLKWKLSDCLLHCESLPVGPRRFLLWKRLLSETNPNVGSSSTTLGNKSSSCGNSTSSDDKDGDGRSEEALELYSR